MGETDWGGNCLVLMGRTMLSKSLIQFSVDGWSCVPSMLFTWGKLWHHWFSGCESEWTPGVGDGQGGLACCNSWGCKESYTTEQLNWTEMKLWWRRKWKPIPVLLPGKSHGWRSLIGYSSWGCKESDTTEQLHCLSFFLNYGGGNENNGDLLQKIPCMFCYI